MLREYLTNRWVYGAIGFLIIFSVACVLWYRYDTAPEKEQLAKEQQMLRQKQVSQIAKTNTHTKQQTDLTTAHTTPATTEKSITKKPRSKVKNTSPSDLSDPTQDDLNVGEGRVSPHGFGPYPKLPEGWRDAWATLSAKDELAMRVWIELLEQGIPVVGIAYSGINRRLIPTIQGTVYVSTDSDGYITSHKGHPSDTAIIRTIRQAKLDALMNLDDDVEITDSKPLSLKLNDIPKSIKVKDLNDGIDPYEFLNLTRSNTK